jgi:hypothetical protein
MPTLIRLIVVLLVLVGIGYGAMLALVMTVHPADKDVTIRIPARDLVPGAQPVERREIDTSTRPAAPAAPAEVPAAPAEAASTPAAAPSDDAPTSDDAPDVQTLAPGVE